MILIIQSLRPPRKYDEYCTRAQRPEYNIHGRIFERTYRLSLFCVKFLRILFYFLTRKRRTSNMNVKREFRICLFMFLSKVVMVQGWLSCCQPQNRNLFSVTQLFTQGSMGQYFQLSSNFVIGFFVYIATIYAKSEIMKLFELSHR